MKVYEMCTPQDLKVLLSRMETENYSSLKDYNIRFAVLLVTNKIQKLEKFCQYSSLCHIE